MYKNVEHKLWINHYQIADSDQFRIEITVHSPNPYFVFAKHQDHFQTEAEFHLSITNLENDKQVYRKSWTVNAVEYFYEDTRHPEKYVMSSLNTTLPEGKYKFSLLIIDKDSKHKWKISQEEEIMVKTSMSELFAVIFENDMYKYLGDEINLNTDLFYLQFQIPIANQEDTISVTYSISDMGSIIGADTTRLIQDGHGFLYLPIRVEKEWLGTIDFTVNVENFSNKIELSFINTSVDKYFQDIPMLVQVMSLILPYDEYKKLSKLEPIDQKLFIYNYWNENDPTPETEENELLMEFYGRMEYANTHFGTLSSGWKSDRGRVLIQNGKPGTVEMTGRDSYGRAYEIWTYSDGRQFVFLDDGFGDYRLYRQTN